MSEEVPLLVPVSGKGCDVRCPGCALEWRLQINKGIPYKEFFFVGITTLASSLPITFLFPFLYFMVISLWAVSDRRYGGLSFSSEDIGQVLAVAGASLLVYQLFFYQWVDKMLGTVNSSRIAAALSTVIVASNPFMAYLSGFKLSLALYPALMIKNILSTTVGTGLSLLQNNAVPQEQRGAANGISTTTMSFFKAVAPIGAGALFSWVQKHVDNAFISGGQVVFLVLNLILCLGVLSTFKPFLVIPLVPEQHI